MLYMVIERFRGGDMECDDATLISRWTERWSDLVDFEVFPVMTSAETVAAIAPRL